MNNKTKLYVMVRKHNFNIIFVFKNNIGRYYIYNKYVIKCLKLLKRM